MEKDEKDERFIEMKKIRDKLFSDKSLPLYKYRTENKYFPVIGEGSHYADIVFIGEAPGKNEAEQGRPFCGASGRLLDDFLSHIGLDREKVYITNIVKDRPEDNRDPRPDEIEAYAGFLREQLKIIKPKAIATLGRFSMEFILKDLDLHAFYKPISQIHGTIIEGEVGYGKISVIPLYHPAVALYNGGKKDELKKDFEILKKFI